MFSIFQVLRKWLTAKVELQNTWQLPGGGADTRESPGHAAIREVEKETGLTIPISHLTIKGTIYKCDEEMLFIVYGYNQALNVVANIQVADNESTTYQFIKPTEVVALISGNYVDFCNYHHS